jgi:hypothetical protein
MLHVRRLTEILATDVVGYCRLMGADEEGMHERLRRTPAGTDRTDAVASTRNSHLNAGEKSIVAQIRSCVGVLVAFFDRREAGLNLVNGRAKGAYAIRETAKIAFHAD